MKREQLELRGKVLRELLRETELRTWKGGREYLSIAESSPAGKLRSKVLCDLLGEIDLLRSIDSQLVVDTVPERRKQLMRELVELMGRTTQIQIELGIE